MSPNPPGDPTAAPESDAIPRFERALDAFLLEHSREQPPLLAEAIRYAVDGGGKRIRPRILYGVGTALGVPSSTLAPLAIALELIHTYTLIHDDLPCMDDDDVRRGRATVHRRFDEATALLAGDALIPLAFEAVTAVESPAAIGALAHAAGGAGVIAGQLDELSLLKNPSLTALFDVFRKKTGALFGAAFELPACLVGGDASAGRPRALRRIGENVGIAFQIADDLEDPLPAPGERPPAHHIRAYQDREESIGWIRQESDRSVSALSGEASPALARFTQSIYREILEKCERTPSSVR